jgi:4-hydroxy-tetrahydrodipicolinate reductase
MVGDHPALVLDHVYRAHDDAAPDWPAPPGLGGYRIEVIGDPSWTVDMEMIGADGTALAAGEVVTGVRVANAIPAVVAAEPGLVTPLQLPLITGRGLFRTKVSR